MAKIANIDYKDELKKLQVELNRIANWVQKHNKRVLVIVEGRDTAGKGGVISALKSRMNGRWCRTVALSKPSEQESGQWYFQRYLTHLPSAGEFVFFDRSWYNRAVVEPVMNFCTKLQYQTFMQQVPEFEHMLYEDGVILIKFWFSISKKEQKKRKQYALFELK